MGFGTSRVNAQSNWVFVLFKARKRTNRSEYKVLVFLNCLVDVSDVTYELYSRCAVERQARGGV